MPTGKIYHYDLHFLGNFENGKAVGKFWIGMKGGGRLHGKVDSSGMISGNEIAYIYPDGETALLGSFQDRYMIKAYEVEVEKYACDDQGFLFVQKYSDRKSNQVFKYELPTNVSFGGGGTFPDPYEMKYSKLGKSKSMFKIITKYVSIE